MFKKSALQLEWENRRGYYKFLKAENLPIVDEYSHPDYWTRFILAHTKGTVEVNRYDTGVMIWCKDQLHQNVGLGGPWEFVYNESYNEDISDIKIYPTLEDERTIQLVFRIEKDKALHYATYEFSSSESENPEEQPFMEATFQKHSSQAPPAVWMKFMKEPSKFR